MDKKNMRLINWTLAFLLIGFVACSPNNVTEDKNLAEFFEKYKVNGSFGMFDNGAGEFFVHNLSRFRDSAYQPGFTFSIVSGLIGLETGRIRDEKKMILVNELSTLTQDSGTTFGINNRISLEQAFKHSTLPYFMELNRLIGKDTMQHWLDTLGYGSRYNKYNIDHIESFWINSSIRITADEQLGLMKKLYFGQLPFQQRTQTIVKQQLEQESNSNYAISYVTGIGLDVNDKQYAWLAGWIEENKHPYFFVLHIDSEKKANLAATGKQILYEILGHYGFLEGRR